jgi:hypothetical protein
VKTAEMITDYGEYDNFGLFHTQTVSETNYGMSLTKRFDYDSKGRFVVKKTDPLGIFCIFTKCDYQL